MHLAGQRLYFTLMNLNLLLLQLSSLSRQAKRLHTLEEIDVAKLVWKTGMRTDSDCIDASAKFVHTR